MPPLLRRGRHGWQRQGRPWHHHRSAGDDGCAPGEINVPTRGFAAVQHAGHYAVSAWRRRPGSWLALCWHGRMVAYGVPRYMSPCAVRVRVRSRACGVCADRVAFCRPNDFRTLLKKKDERLAVLIGRELALIPTGKKIRNASRMIHPPVSLECN